MRGSCLCGQVEHEASALDSPIRALLVRGIQAEDITDPLA